MTVPQPSCPHCREVLLSYNEALGCPQHGVLLRLREFERLTSRKYSQRLWTFWFRLQRPGGLRCPDCRSAMIVLNPHDSKKLELDCCPGCYAIWLDSGELSELHRAFAGFETSAGAEQTQTADSAQARQIQDVLARELLKHDERVTRYHKITALGEALIRRVPWWRRLMIQ